MSDCLAIRSLTAINNKLTVTVTTVTVILHIGPKCKLFAKKSDTVA